MLTLLLVITATDSFEMYGQSFEEAGQRFAAAYPDVPFKIFLTGEVPTWTRLDGWNRLTQKFGDLVAKHILWTIDERCV